MSEKKLIWKIFLFISVLIAADLFRAIETDFGKLIKNSSYNI